MHVGVCRLTLHIHASQSLKDKRQVVRSVSDRLRQKFGVSVAEVDNQDKWQLATLGLTAVSGDLATLRSMLDRAIEFVQATAPEADVTNTEVDVFDY